MFQTVGVQTKQKLKRNTSTKVSRKHRVFLLASNPSYFFFFWGGVQVFFFWLRWHTPHLRVDKVTRLAPSETYPVLRQVADPVYPREKRPCGLDVDEQALGTHCRLHTAREEICSHQQHNHTSIHDQSSRGRSHWPLAHGHVCETPALQGHQGEGATCLCTTNRYRRHTRVPLMVTIMAIARGGLSWEINGATNPHSIIAILSVG